MSLSERMDDGKRQMQVCNACRYCEGFCAVWRAIEWRRDFTDKDMAYLANLCHDCKECVFACPFMSPHQFAVNPPKLFGGLREELYKKYGWPGGLAKVVGNNRGSFWIVSVIGFLLLITVVLASNGATGLLNRHFGSGAFYQVLSEMFLEVAFGALGLWFVGGWIIGAVRFWCDIKSEMSKRVLLRDLWSAARDALRLRYLGREVTEDELAGHRKWLHQFVMYGFLLDFASTTLGAFYSHVLHIQAPYPIYNPVVILGTIGGIGIIIGAVGMLYVKSKSDRSSSDQNAKRSGNTFTVSLLMVAATGMLVLLFRDTAAMGILLVVHLSSVASLFFTAPYTKFVHFVYRYIALVRYAEEERTVHEGAHET